LGYRAWVLKSVRFINPVRLMSFTKGNLAKNVVLAGVKSVTLYDPEPVTVNDLSTQVSTS
jgi:molybdopterin/thiamine biosynthesis adenylyltransferase